MSLMRCSSLPDSGTSRHAHRASKEAANEEPALVGGLFHLKREMSPRAGAGRKPPQADRPRHIDDPLFAYDRYDVPSRSNPINPLANQRAFPEDLANK